MSHTLRAFFTVAAALAIALPVSAQQTWFTDGDAEAPTAVSMQTSSIFPGPSMASAALAVPAPQVTFDASFDALPVAMAQPSRQNTTLMIVGGAAIIVGAVIGGDAGTIFMVGGGVIGLIGLYRHLQ
jgi:hypothetical protein